MRNGFLNWTVIFGIILGLWVDVAMAYDPLTHQKMSSLALERTRFQQSDLFWHLGISTDPIVELESERVEFVTEGESKRFWRLSQLVKKGARDEDHGLRPRHHFFDPYFNRPLEISSAALGNSSVDWALEDSEGDLQEWSLRDLKNFSYQGLIAGDKQTSDLNWGRAFIALGHVVHHVQDMGQPQHTRNDVHLDIEFCGALSNELCLYEPSFYEWLSAHMAEGGFSHHSAGQILGPSNPGSYTNVSLYRERDYWTHSSGYGIADYSNGNFVTEDSNFLLDGQGYFMTGEYPQPGVDSWLEDYVDGESFIGQDGEPLSGRVYLVKAPVSDDYLETDGEYTHFTSSWSMLAGDVRDAIDAGVPAELFDERGYFYLNRLNMESANHHLYLRAIGYTAGFIDHVFRGRLEITPPEGGVYGIVDHAVTNEGSIPAVEGFTTINLKVRNATEQQTSPDPDVAADGHWVKQGKLVAVALYRPNPCYSPDLKGERHWPDYDIPTGCTVQEWLSTEQRRSVSAEIQIPDGLDTIEYSSLSFDFSNDPIPVSARDLSIQVVFRGELGGDQDAIAVGRKEISEPTWIGGMNSTDYFWVDTEYRESAEFLASDDASSWGVAGQEVELGEQSIVDMAYFNDTTGENLTGWTTLDERAFHRLAVLTEPDEMFWLRMDVLFEHKYLSARMGFYPALTWLEEKVQAAPVPGFEERQEVVRTWHYTPVNTFRGMSGSVLYQLGFHVGEQWTFEDWLGIPSIDETTTPRPIPLPN